VPGRGRSGFASTSRAPSTLSSTFALRTRVAEIRNVSRPRWATNATVARSLPDVRLERPGHRDLAKGARRRGARGRARRARAPARRPALRARRRPSSFGKDLRPIPDAGQPPTRLDCGRRLRVGHGRLKPLKRTHDDVVDPRAFSAVERLARRAEGRVELALAVDAFPQRVGLDRGDEAPGVSFAVSLKTETRSRRARSPARVKRWLLSFHPVKGTLSNTPLCTRRPMMS